MGGGGGLTGHWVVVTGRLVVVNHKTTVWW